MVLPSNRRCSTGSGIGVDGDLHIQAPEYSRAVHFDANYYWPLIGVKSEAGISVPQVVVGSGGVIPCRTAGGG